MSTSDLPACTRVTSVAPEPGMTDVYRVSGAGATGLVSVAAGTHMVTGASGERTEWPQLQALFSEYSVESVSYRPFRAHVVFMPSSASQRMPAGIELHVMFGEPGYFLAGIDAHMSKKAHQVTCQLAVRIAADYLTDERAARACLDAARDREMRTLRAYDSARAKSRAARIRWIEQQHGTPPRASE